MHGQPEKQNASDTVLMLANAKMNLH